jgi:hypothetical protein
MAIQYYMRAYNTSTLQYVDWVVNDTPDTTGVYAPGGSTHLTNIVINRSVQSKVQNFLKPVVEPTYITNVSYNNPQDGYLFHLNSYDWLNPVVSTGPITIPSLSQPIGISIVRGSASTGQPFTPSNYASLFWEEGTQNWNFAFINSNGSIGNPLAVSMGSAFIDGYALIDGYLTIVPNLTVQAALSGAIRLSNAESVVSRNFANTADLVTLATDVSNNAILGNATQNVIIGGTAANVIGNASSNTTTIAGNLLVLGSSTTVESTTVDIVGRVIHGNYSTAPSVPPPTMIAGYSIHRGAGVTNQNDGAALIWIEGAQVITGSDGFWLTATITQDIDTVSQSSLPNIVKTMTGGVYVSSTPNPALTTLPTVGGLRTQNATTAVSARNAASSLDLLLLGTDNSNRIIHGAGINNDGHIFNSASAATIPYDFQINSVSQVQVSANTISFTSTDTAPSLIQGTTASATGQLLTIQAQNAVTTGGGLNLSSGTGTTAGNVHIQTGGTTILSVHPTFVIFNDSTGAATYTVTPLSTGTTTLQAATGVTAVNYNQALAATGTGAPTTLQAQSVTTGTGGLLNLASGFGTVASGVINFQPGGTTALALNATGSMLHWVNTVVGPTITQDDVTTASASGNTLTVKAQNATGTTSIGGALILTSGSGTLGAANVNINTGGITKISVNPNFTTFNDTNTSLTITPVSAGTTQITYASTVLGSQINQASTASATGAPMLVQAQNASTTGGSLTLTTGTGVTAGSLHLQTGGVDQILITPTLTTITNNTVIDGTLTVYDGTANPQVQFSQNNILFANTDGYATISQAATYASSVTGATMTVAAQSALGSLGIGGNLILTSGVGSVLDGYIDLQAGGVAVATVEPNKFVFNQGTRRNVTSVFVDGYMDGYFYYQVLVTDSLVAIASLSAPLTVILPLNPIVGDTYEIKDTTGLAGTYPIIVDGNGINIDDPTTPAITLSKPYGDLVVTYTGTSWSVTSYYFEGIL